MKAVFADTFYYLALLDPHDSTHEKAVSVTRGLESNIVTTAWVLLELANSLSSLRHRRVFADLLDKLRATQASPSTKQKGNYSILVSNCIVAEKIRIGL